MDAHTHDVAVIGAGPYGLATGAHLRSRGVDVAVFGQTMSSWREAMPAGMLLKSELAASNISSPEPETGIGDYINRTKAVVGADPRRIPVETFIDYGTWFANSQLADTRRDEMIRALSRNGDTFRLDLESGAAVNARAVVVAAGHRMHARMPAELEGVAADSDLVSHTSEHSDLGTFRDRRVAVIGAGQSALETVALLHELGASPVLIVRRPAVDWDLPPHAPTLLYRMRRPISGLGPGWPKRILETHAELVRPMPAATRHYLLRAVLGPSGACWLRDRVEPYVETHVDSRVVSADAAPDHVVLRLATSTGEPECIEADHVIAATGYSFELDRLGLIDAGLRSGIHTVGGYPHLSSHLESSVPGLYFAGLAAGGTFGPVMRFVCGTKFAASRVATSIARRHRRHRPVAAIRRPPPQPERTVA